MKSGCKGHSFIPLQIEDVSDTGLHEHLYVDRNESEGCTREC